MQISYMNQPELVPPMVLRVYDDLPSPAMSTPSRMTNYMDGGRRLASRASSRASSRARALSQSRSSLFAKKQPSRKPITIGRPTEFRRTDAPFARGASPFRPLELSIYLPGNRLSPLPSFSEEYEDLEALQYPARALIRAKSDDALSRMSTFTVRRKPVASVSRYSSFDASSSIYESHASFSSSPQLKQTTASYSSPQLSSANNPHATKDHSACQLPPLPVAARVRTLSEPPNTERRPRLADTRRRATSEERHRVQSRSVDFDTITEERIDEGDDDARSVSSVYDTPEMPSHAFESVPVQASSKSSFSRPKTPRQPASVSSLYEDETTEPATYSRVAQWITKSPYTEANAASYNTSPARTEHTRNTSISSFSSGPSMTNVSSVTSGTYPSRRPTFEIKRTESQGMDKVREVERLPPPPYREVEVVNDGTGVGMAF